MSQPRNTSTTLTRGELTARAIRQAIVRIENGRPKVVQVWRKISIKAVAEEAGVSRATIHNNHPDLAERIRSVNNKAVRAQRDGKTTEIKILRAKYSSLKYEYTKTRKLYQDMASEMASLVAENRRLLTIVENKKISGL